MDFSELYKLVIPTRKGILDLVDEYTLYCHYTGIDNIIIGRTYQSPFREDDCPSFSIFVVHGQDVQYMWKDHAVGESGSIFGLIQRIERLNDINEVIAAINDDFALGFNTDHPVREKVSLYDSPRENKIKIIIKECPFTIKGKAFWRQFDIGEELLALYNVSQVSYYWTWEGQQIPIDAVDPTFAYRVGGYYQLYSPAAERKYKFRNDLPENYFFGYMQLPETGEKLIIDKSSKDVIFCRRLGLDAVCGKSETTFIPHHKMLELKSRFKRVFLMLDDDPAGRKMAEKYKKMYPWLEVRFLVMAKDKTDLCLKVGFEEAKRQIMETIC